MYRLNPIYLTEKFNKICSMKRNFNLSKFNKINEYILLLIMIFLITKVGINYKNDGDKITETLGIINDII